MIFWTPPYYSTFSADYFDQKFFLKNHNFSSKNRLFKKKGLTAFKLICPHGWDPSQMKEQIFGFPKMVYISCGKLWKNSCGVLKWDHFSKRAIFQKFNFSISPLEGGSDPKWPQMTSKWTCMKICKRISPISLLMVMKIQLLRLEPNS